MAPSSSTRARRARWDWGVAGPAVSADSWPRLWQPPQAGHLGGVGIHVGGQLLGLLGLEAGGDLAQDGGGRLQPGQVEVLVRRWQQVTAAQDVELGVGAPPAQAT
jgi:hypothetical protein